MSILSDCRGKVLHGLVHYKAFIHSFIYSKFNKVINSSQFSFFLFIIFVHFTVSLRVRLSTLSHERRESDRFIPLTSSNISFKKNRRKRKRSVNGYHIQLPKSFPSSSPFFPFLPIFRSIVFPEVPMLEGVRGRYKEGGSEGSLQ